MNEQIQDEQKPFSESLKDFIAKVKPYALLLWKRRWKLITFNTVVMVITVLYLLFLTKPYFKSSVTILPNYGNKSSEMLGQLSGLASLAGVSVGSADPTQIYENLLKSESVLSPVIYAKYQTEEFEKPVNLIEYFEIKPDKNLNDSLQQRKMFLQAFQGLSKGVITTDVDRMTKILTITVQMPESKLSAEVANNIAKSLDNYIRTQRKSFASAQREYLDTRVKQVKDTLNLFEERLKNFREQNRMITQSPELQLEQARLMRNVEIQQTIYGELVKQLELVKLEEVRDTPVVNVEEYAKEPIIKAGPKRAVTLIVIMFFAVVLSSVYYASKDNLKEFVKSVKKL
ncbi:MAG: Wzz/FepE/Etk N-terminal domain-containing protein [Bacteroidetes bacterium]|nr:Wzz/FepE/Etk N-terminal domain-containing protein [Bacteroidota bacterium]